MTDNIFDGLQKQDAYIKITFYQKDEKDGPSPQVEINGTMQHAMRGAAGILYSIHLQSKIPMDRLLSFFCAELILMVSPGNATAVDMSALEKLGGG